VNLPSKLFDDHGGNQPKEQTELAAMVTKTVTVIVYNYEKRKDSYWKLETLNNIHPDKLLVQLGAVANFQAPLLFVDSDTMII